MAKLGEGLQFTYEPIIEQAPLDKSFHYLVDNEDGTKDIKMKIDGFKLITDIEELKTYIEKCKGKIIGFDTETTGLTYGEDKIVGFSISLDDLSGFYVPIRHQNRTAIKTKVDKVDENGNQVLTKTGKVATKTITTYEYSDCEENLDPKEALDTLYQILIGAKTVLMHNSEFDLNMLKFEGYDVLKINSFDNLILPYLYDPEATGLAGLKALEKRVLGREVPEFKDVLGKDAENFAFVKPEDGYVYACYDDKTEVLTELGWVKWPFYDGKTKLATINTTNGNAIEYQHPLKLYKYEYSGPMECCKSQSIDYCVTPNHKMVVAESQGKKKNFKWLFKRADELNVEEVALTAGHTSSSNNKILLNFKEYDLSVLAPLAALVLADGYCRNRKNHSGYSINICTNIEKNYDKIEEILNNSGLKWNKYKRDSKVINWECSNKDIWEWLYPYAGHGALNKRVPKEILQASEEVINKFLQAYSITDGHNYLSGATRFYTISEGMVDDLQTLLIISGKRSSVYSRLPKDCTIEGREVKSENCHKIYHIKITGDKSTRYKKRNRFQVNYCGVVYCAEVPNHTLITRRNGSTLVAGNCCDTAGLIGVFNKMYPLVKNLLSRFKKPLVFDGKPYNVINKDNNLVKAFVDYYGHAKILIDRKKAIKYKEQLEAEQKKVINEIYSFFDKGMFNLSTSSLEFKEVMASKNLFTGVKTDKGGDSWSKKAAGEMKRNLNKVKDCMDNWSSFNFTDSVLSKSGPGFQLYQMIKLYGSEYFKLKLDTKNEVKILGKDGSTLEYKPFWRLVQAMYNGEMEKLRILMLIQKNNSLNKALNSYVDKLTQVDECYMRYRLKGTKSGRLSSGNGSKSDKRKNHYYIDLNAQNLTKPASSYYVAEKCESNDPENILGWKFTPVDTDYAMSHLEDLYIVEGQDSGITIRGCLKAPEGKTEWAWVTESSMPQLPEGAQEGEVELFKISLSGGASIICSKSTIFRTLYRGKEQPFTVEQLIPCKDEYDIIGNHKTQLGKIVNAEPLGVQKAFKLPKGKYDVGSFLIYSGIHLGKRYVVSLDYDAQEYKLMAILSQDSKMLENFRKGIDPHTASAYAIWGEENYDKAKRKKAKIFNFLNNYSGGAYTLSQQLDIPLKDAEKMIESYNKTFWEMVEWKNKEINDMKMNDYVVFNAFGRPRQFKGWMKTINKNNDLMYTNLVQKDEIQKASNRVAAAVERRVSSHIIQGTAGDILRLVLSNLYKKYFKVRNPQVDFLSTVHDEINYTIDTKVATEYIKELEELMTFDALSKELPITTSTDVGFTYGNMFPFVWENPETKKVLIPKRVHHA